MSGRNLRDFVVSHRNQFQDAEEQKHLIARAMVGLDSDRYRRVDYEEAKLAASRYKDNAEKASQKLGQIKRRARLGRERNMIKNHYLIWEESYKHLHNICTDLERALEEEVSDVVKTLYNLGEGELANEVEICFSESNSEVQKFSKATVLPVEELISDVKLRLDQVLTKDASKVSQARADLEKDGNVILQEIHSVKTQCLSVKKWILYQRSVLETDLGRSPLIKNSESEHPTIPSLERALPVEVVFFNCPDAELKQMVLRQFVNLHTNYDKRIKEEQARMKSIAERYDDRISEDFWTLSTVYELYHHFIPHHLQSNVHSLVIDMMSRLLKNKTKYQILEMESHFLKQRYSKKQCEALVSNYYRDFENLKSTALTAFAEAHSAYASAEAAARDHLKQKQICRALHKRVLLLRAKQEEISQLEEEINAQARMREQEEEEKRRWLENERRTKLKSDISRYRSQKQREEYRKQIEREKRLELLKAEVEAQKKIDQERVQYRSKLLEEKAALLEAKERVKYDEEQMREKRLEELRQTVAVVAESNPERLVADTVSSKAKLGIGTKDDVALQTPLFNLYGYSQKQIEGDIRLRVEEALRNAGIHNTDYARQVLSTIKPPTQPRPDADSSALQYMFHE